MADNTELATGSGGDTIATDDVSDAGVANGAKVQRTKAGFGSDNNYADPLGGTGVDAPGVGRVSLATDIPLPAGTNAIGKLSANSGVDIGDVDVTSVIPGTGATNLGKAIGSTVGATDTGIALLGKHKEDQVHLTSSDDEYDALTIDSLGSLHVNAEAHHIFDELDATTGWSVLGNDTTNLDTTAKHVMGTLALTFDKANGAANTIFAGIQKTLSSTDLGDVSPHDILQGSFYASSYADVSYAFLRLGTDASNYNEWRIDAAVLTDGVFETGALTIGDADYDGITGTGMDSTAITYIAVGMAFNTETDTLTGIIFDQLSYHTNQHTSTSINSEVTSSVSSANVNINKIANKTANTQAGNVSTGTQRVTIATDDANLAAIKTSTELIDDSIYTDSDAWTATTSKHQLSGGVYNATPLSVTDGDTVPIALDVNGHTITSSHAASIALADDVSNTVNLQVDEAEAFMATATFNYVYDGSTWDRLRGDSTNGMTVNLGSNNDVTVTSGTITANLSATDNAVLDQIELNTSYGDSVGAGTEAAALRVTLATDSTGLLSIDDNGGSITVDNGGTFATQATLQAGTAEIGKLAAGTAAIGKLAANSGVDIGDVDVTSISAGTNLVGDVGISGARTSGGTTLYKNIDVDESEDQVKGTGGQLYWVHAINLGTTVRYLKIYNATAATVVVGTTVPDLTFPIPTQGDANGAGFSLSIPNGIAFGTAITIAATTGVADADSGAPGANEVIVNLGYA